MVNAPQSSRVAGVYNKSLFTNVGVAGTPNNKYFAEKSFTQAGENNIQIKQKESANVLHYLIGAAIIVALVIYASKKLD
jgi:hypothetical protein